MCVSSVCVCVSVCVRVYRLVLLRRHNHTTLWAQCSFHSHVLPRAPIPCLAYTQVIEGARYWGSVIDSNLLVKYNECGNAVRLPSLHLGNK